MSPVPRGHPPVSLTFTELLREAYRRHARRTAVIDGDVTLTYAELERDALAITAALQAEGIAPGERIVLVLGNGHRFFAYEHACYLGGWIRCCLSPRLHDREIAGIVEDCEAAVLVVEGNAEVGELPPSVKRLIRVGIDDPAGDPAAAVVNEPQADDVLGLIYTSGTTGKPKGVIFTHAGWVPMCRNLMVDFPPLDQHDVMLHVGPLSHLSGYIAGMFFFQGATQVIKRAFAPEDTLDTIAAQRVTCLVAVPTMVNMMLPVAQRKQGDYSSLRALMYGAAPMAPDRVATAVRLFGDILIQGFGQSELGLPLTTMSARAHRLSDNGDAPEHLASAGRPTPWVQIRIVDDALNELPAGEVGEIYARGESSMSGYWNRPEDTAATMHAGGWVLTGDMGRFDDAGYLYIVDRKKDMIVSGGYNVYPTEVENAISTLPAVAEVAVVGVPHEQWGESILAAVVVREGASLSEDDVIAACTSQLAAYKKPRVVEFLAELPKTASGKIRRRELRDRYWEGSTRAVG